MDRATDGVAVVVEMPVEHAPRLGWAIEWEKVGDSSNYVECLTVTKLEVMSGGLRSRVTFLVTDPDLVKVIVDDSFRLREACQSMRAYFRDNPPVSDWAATVKRKVDVALGDECR